MSKGYLKPIRILALAVLLVLSIALAGSSTTVGQAAPLTAAVPMVNAQVFDVNCATAINLTTTYAKYQDLATFTVQSPNSTVEVTFNGRIRVGSFAGSTGAIFELRVDNAATTHSRARAKFGVTDSPNEGIQASITGIFTGLTAGNHTASMWVRTFYGTGTGAMLDPGCWGTDSLIVREYTPFGFTFMPSVQRP